jgi:hypothetical protein
MGIRKADLHPAQVTLMKISAWQPGIAAIEAERQQILPDRAASGAV